VDLWPVDVDAPGAEGHTLLHCVVADARLSKARTLKCCRELVEVWGADVSVANDLDFSPVMSAAALGDRQTVAYLIHRGADLDTPGAHPNGFVGAPARPGRHARSPRDWAEAYGHADVVRLIDAALLSRRAAAAKGRAAAMPAEEDDEGRLGCGDPDGGGAAARNTTRHPPPGTPPTRTPPPTWCTTWSTTPPATTTAQNTNNPTNGSHHLRHRGDQRSKGGSKKVRPRRERYCVPTCAFAGANVGEMVACERCERWFHCECVGVDLARFRALVRDRDAEYHCDACAAAIQTEQRAQHEGARASAEGAGVRGPPPPPSPSPEAEGSSSNVVPSVEPVLSPGGPPGGTVLLGDPPTRGL